MTDKDAKKASEGGLSSMLNVVPTIYYDLIARICPGLAFWLAIALSGSSLGALGKLETLAKEHFVVMLVLSYLAGIVLTGASVIWDAITFALFLRIPALRGPLGLERQCSFVEAWHEVAQKMESVAKKSEAAGGIVTKALAEVTLCENLLTALLVLSCLGWLSSGRLFFDPAATLGYLLGAFFSLFIAMAFRQLMFLGRVEALYVMYQAGDG